MRRLIPAKFTAILLVLVAALKALGEPVRPEDLWWHLAMGRAIVTAKSIPRVDSFSFTAAGAPFFDQAWLSQIILYTIYRGVGLAGLLACNFAWVVVALYVVVIASVRRGASLVGAVLVLLVLAPLAMRGWAVRPQILCVPLFALFGSILGQWRTDRILRSDEVPEKWAFWKLAALVPLTALWANLHGSFVLALLFVVAMLAAGALDDYSVNRPLHRRSLRDLALMLVGCALATLVNPRGAAIYRYVVEIAANAQVHLAREWQPPNRHDAESYCIWIVLSLTTVSSFKRARLGDLALILPFGLLESMAVRNGIWLSFVLAPIISTRFFTGDPAANKFLFRGALLVSIACLFIPWVKPHLVSRPYGSLAWEPRTPINAVADFAREQTPPKRIFAQPGFGGYVTFAFPSARVFSDSRLELYPKPIWDELATTENGDLSALDRWSIDCVLVSRNEEPRLREALVHSPSFALHYEDADVSTFVRR